MQQALQETEKTTTWNKEMLRRPRRNRKSESIRRLLQEHHLLPCDFVCPLFLVEGEGERQSIEGLPGIFRYSLDKAIIEAKELYRLGIPAINLFTYVPKEKRDALASEAVRPGNLMQKAIQTIKDAIPKLCVMTDIALDPFTNHGHDGLVGTNGDVLNDETIDVLCQMTLLAAKAGVDIVAPSDMMDGRVRALREALDTGGYTNVGIMSYAAKYASALYGPFREALHSTPCFGDKKGYQLNPANGREALVEAALDEAEGADILLVKPAIPYLDIITNIRAASSLPIAAYHVSGEYAMVKAAAEKGWIDGDRVMVEQLTAIKRAGADFILSYAAKEVAERL